jgi:hypothetical protein
MRALTKLELEQSERGPKFENVKPSDCFGVSSSCALSNEVRKLNPRRWYELQQEHLYESGQQPRPLDFYK